MRIAVVFLFSTALMLPLHAAPVTVPSGIPGIMVTTGGALPKLPAYAPIYPGATGVAVMSRSDGRPMDTNMIAFSTRDKVSQVIAFYKDLAGKNGMPVKHMMVTATVQSFSVSKGGKLLNITASPNTGITQVDMSYK